MGFLNSHCGVAAGCLKPPESPLSPRSAIWLVANLDALYYDLLQFFLRSGGKGPAIPPPHTYFPAVTAKHPGESAQLYTSAAFSVPQAAESRRTVI